MMKVHKKVRLFYFLNNYRYDREGVFNKHITRSWKNIIAKNKK